MAKTGGKLHGEALPSVAGATVIPISLDCTGWSINQIREHIRALGWEGCHINIPRMFRGDGKTIVTRLA